MGKSLPEETPEASTRQHIHKTVSVCFDDQQTLINEPAAYERNLVL